MSKIRNSDFSPAVSALLRLSEATHVSIEGGVATLPSGETVDLREAMGTKTRRYVGFMNGFHIFFEAETETVDKKKHFMNGCGWTHQQYKAIQKYPWFSARVMACDRAGRILGEAFLGCCCYETVEAFYTTYKDDYFADLVQEATGLATREQERSGVAA